MGVALCLGGRGEWDRSHAVGSCEVFESVQRLTDAWGEQIGNVQGAMAGFGK